MQKFAEPFHQLLQTLLTTLKYQFPIVRTLPVTNQYFDDILQLLTQNNLLPERPLNRLKYIKQFVDDPDTIDEQTIAYMQDLLAYFHVTAATKDAQNASKSRLSQLLVQLDIASKQTVVNGQAALSDLQRYLNIPLPCQPKVEQILRSLESTNRSLTILCGQSGTGKSQLLSFLRTQKPELFQLPNLEVKDNAGLSADPGISTDTQLVLDFQGFSDDATAHATVPYHRVMTMHTDFLAKFYQLARKLGTYTHLAQLVTDTGFASQQYEDVITDDIQIIFIDQDPFCHLSADPTQTQLFDQLAGKLFSANPYGNPFFEAYQADVKQNLNTVLHKNYHILTHPQILDSVKYLLNKAQLEHSHLFSVRELLTFFHDIMMPKFGRQPIENSVFFQMFPKHSEHRILKDLTVCDPISLKNVQTTTTLADFHETEDKRQYMMQLLAQNNLPEHWVQDFYDYFIDDTTSEILQARLFLRILFMLDHEMPLFNDPVYKLYAKGYRRIQLGYFDKTLMNYCYVGLSQWNGSPEKGLIYLEPDAPKKTVPLDASIYYMSAKPTAIAVHLSVKDALGEHLFQFQLTLGLFHYFYQLAKHYMLLPQDRTQAGAFSDFMKHLVTSLRLPKQTV